MGAYRIELELNSLVIFREICQRRQDLQGFFITAFQYQPGCPVSADVHWGWLRQDLPSWRLG